MSFIKSLLNFLLVTKREKRAEPLENFEALKKEFLEINSRSNTEETAKIRLYSLATRIASIFGGPDQVYILINALKVGMDEPPESFKELLRGANLSTLIKEFKAVHLMMLTAFNENVQAKLSVRLSHVATEIINRLGGLEFLLMLNAVLTRQMISVPD